MKKQAGFTLLEVVVSLAILAIGVTAVMQVFSGGLGNLHRIEKAHRAIAHAENVMNRLLADEDIFGPHQESGDLDEDFFYSAAVQDWVPPDTGLSLDVGQPNISLLSVEVEVHFRNDIHGKLYRVVSLKAVAQEPDLSGIGTDSLRQLFRGNR